MPFEPVCESAPFAVKKCTLMLTIELPALKPAAVRISIPKELPDCVVVNVPSLTHCQLDAGMA